MKICCPICQTRLEVPDDFEARPFCSLRCKKIDLHHWLEGNYTLPRALSAEDLENLPDEQRDEVLAKAFGLENDDTLH